MSFSIDATDFDAAALALEQLEDPIGDAAQLAVPQLAGDVADEVRAGARRHGGLARQVTESSRGSGIRTTARVHAGGLAAAIIVHGAAPHAIRPMHARALELGAGGAKFAARVSHPGFPADPFVARAATLAPSSGAATLDHTASRLAADVATRLEG